MYSSLYVFLINLAHKAEELRLLIALCPDTENTWGRMHHPLGSEHRDMTHDNTSGWAGIKRQVCIIQPFNNLLLWACWYQTFVHFRRAMLKLSYIMCSQMHPCFVTLLTYASQVLTLIKSYLLKQKSFLLWVLAVEMCLEWIKHS